MSEKSGGVSGCELVLAEIKQESKAARLFWVFKPSECVHGEPFDLQLSFRNETVNRFEGGECQFQIKGKLSYSFRAALPVIEPNEVKTVTFPKIVLGEVGFIALSSIRINSRDGKLVPIMDKTSSGLLDPHYAQPLSFASKEEIYQKYAVIVALASSALASVLTVVNVIVALLK